MCWKLDSDSGIIELTMKYAVVVSGGKQYKVQEGDVVVVDQLPVDANSAYAFSDVLLFVDGDKREVGLPTLTGVKVSGKVLEHTKGEKIRVAKFKAKAKYRRVRGFRASLTKVQIESIETGKSK
jgi:large subunit ribosomal protein L21